MKMWEKCGRKWSGLFRVGFLPDNLTLSNWRFMVCSEIRIVLVYGLGYIHTYTHTHTHTHTHTPTHTDIHKHTHTHTHTNIFTLLPFAPRHGSSCRLWIKKCISVKIQTNLPCLNSALCSVPTKKSLVTNLATQTLVPDKGTYLLTYLLTYLVQAAEFWRS